MIFSQNIKGHIENDKQQPLSESSIQINENKNLSYSDHEGNFAIDGIDKFPVSLTIRKTGYRDYSIELEESEMSLNIILKKDTLTTIEAVTIKANKPLLKRKIDRLEFNIENTPLQNLNAWDILKSTPNILMKSDEISVRGN